MVRVSVVIPAHNAESVLADCLRALAAQSLPEADYEVIAVDDGSTDATASVAEGLGVRLLRQHRQGAPAARNAGIRAASGEWVALTDADCVPSRGWLDSLLLAVGERDGAEPALGAAGPLLGYQSDSAAARFVDLSGGLDVERHLSHPQFPFAPTGNVMYRHEALTAVGGFDPRYAAYDACDLHTRLRRRGPGPFYFAPRALVLHRHRTTWPAYWRQQFGYGRGYGQFLLHHRDEVHWSWWREVRAWGDVIGFAAAACRPGRNDRALVRRGRFAKSLAQRLGVLTAYWNPRERARWQ